MNDHIQALEKLSEGIKAHQMLELLDFHIAPPIKDSELKDIEAQAKVTIPDPVKQFYQSANGAVLKWRFKPDLSPDVKNQAKQQFQPMTSYPESIFDVAGNIELLSLQDMLLNDEYALPQTEDVEGEFDFDGTIYSDNQFSRMLRPFDVIAEFFCIAFVVQPKLPNWKLMLLGDYWIEYDSSRVTWIDDYIKFTTSTWGIIEARIRLFSEHRGDRLPPLEFDSSLIADLVPKILLSSEE